MSLLGLELSDAGIVVAAQAMQGLLRVDGMEQESPGFALPHKKQLLVGCSAQRSARLHPRQVVTHFWDQLSTDPLQPSIRHAQNAAELACAHLASIWDHVKPNGEALVMSVPGFFSQQQLGLLLAIAEELDIPLKCFVAAAVAASSQPCPDRMLLHLDMHLHRSELTFLEQGDRLTQKDTATTVGQGLYQLYAEWVKVIADEFVRVTRFDPLHHANSEQELYNRLPDILAQLQHQPTVRFEMMAGRKPYSVTLSRDPFVEKSAEVFQEIRRLMLGMRDHYGSPEQGIVLQMTHRVARLPGHERIVANLADIDVIELEPGAGAFGVMSCWETLSAQVGQRQVPLFSGRPWHTTMPNHIASAAPNKSMQTPVRQPTHILYRNLAYPLSEQPLVIGRSDGTDAIGLCIEGELAGVSRKHCSIRLFGEDVILTDHSTYGTFVGETRVDGSARLQLGQFIRVGTPGEILQLIACVTSHEA